MNCQQEEDYKLWPASKEFTTLEALSVDTNLLIRSQLSHNCFLVTSSVRCFVATCDAHKSYDERPAVLLQPLMVTEFRWQSVLVDLMTQLPETAAGHAIIVVFVDRVSKMLQFAP